VYFVIIWYYSIDQLQRSRFIGREGKERVKGRGEKGEEEKRKRGWG